MPSFWRDLGDNLRTIGNIAALIVGLIGVGVWKQSIDTRFEVMAADNARTYQTITQASSDIQTITHLLNERGDKTDAQINTLRASVDGISQRVATLEGYLKSKL